MKVSKESWHPRWSAPGFLFRTVVLDAGPLDIYISHSGFYGHREWYLNLCVFVGGHRVLRIERSW